jgi:hypothetical protein
MSQKSQNDNVARSDDSERWKSKTSMKLMSKDINDKTHSNIA